jgi:ribulose 1,5-bisphosphate synthetase/thiazole synthase
VPAGARVNWERCTVPDVDRYDILVLGSGESGKYLAWTMATAGHRTAVIEQKLIGGSCPNVSYRAHGPQIGDSR